MYSAEPCLDPASPRASSRGFTLIELLVVVAVIAIIAAIAIPGLMRSRQAGNEASAIGSVRAIISGEVAYAGGCASGGFASSLAALALAPAGGVPFITPDVAVGAKSGYNFTLGSAAGSMVVMPGASTCNRAATDAMSGYFLAAVPVAVGWTGQRSFATDQRGVVYEDLTGMAIADPIPAGTRTLQ